MEPKFKVGDRIQSTPNGLYKGQVTEVYLMYEVKWDDGSHDNLSGEDLQHAKLSAEDAWLEVALLVGREVSDYGKPLYDNEKRDIRHKAYQILGGNGVKVTEEVKARVRALIERAVAQHS